MRTRLGLRLTRSDSYDDFADTSAVNKDSAAIELVEFPRVLPNSEHAKLIKTILLLMQEMGIKWLGKEPHPPELDKDLKTAKRIHAGLLLVQKYELFKKICINGKKVFNGSHLAQSVIDKSSKLEDFEKFCAELEAAEPVYKNDSRTILIKYTLALLVFRVNLQEIPVNEFLRLACTSRQFNDKLHALYTGEGWTLSIFLYLALSSKHSLAYENDALVKTLQALEVAKKGDSCDDYLVLLRDYVLDNADSIARQNPQFITILEKGSQFYITSSVNNRINKTFQWVKELLENVNTKPAKLFTRLDAVTALESQRTQHNDIIPEELYPRVLSAWGAHDSHFQNRQASASTVVESLRVLYQRKLFEKYIETFFKLVNAWKYDVDQIKAITEALIVLGSVPNFDSISAHFFNQVLTKRIGNPLIFLRIRDEMAVATLHNFSNLTCLLLLKNIANDGTPNKAYLAHNLANVSCHGLPEKYHAQFLTIQASRQAAVRIIEGMVELHVVGIIDQYLPVYFNLIKPLLVAKDFNPPIENIPKHLIALDKAKLPEHICKRILTAAHGAPQDFLGFALQIYYMKPSESNYDRILYALKTSQSPQILVARLMAVHAENLIKSTKVIDAVLNFDRVVDANRLVNSIKVLHANDLLSAENLQQLANYPEAINYLNNHAKAAANQTTFAAMIQQIRAITLSSTQSFWKSNPPVVRPPQEEIHARIVAYL